MEMTMQALYGYLGAIAAIIFAALGVYFNGRKSGHDAAETKRKQEEIEKQNATLFIREKVDNIIKEAKREADSQDITSVRDRLKSSSVRKPADKA